LRMAQIPGFTPMTDASVSYPSTYNDARNAAFNSAATTVGGNVPYTPMDDSPRGSFRGGRGQGRGRGGGRYPKSEKSPKPYSCANKHPIQALKDLRQDAKFEVICQYLTNGGAAIVVTTTIDDVVYQGEGTNSSTARCIAAHKALVGMNANGHEQLAMNVDLAEQKKLVMERITKWQEEQAVRDAKKAEIEKIKAERLLQPAAKKAKNNNGDSSEVNQSPSNPLTYGILIHRYGPNIVENTAQLEEKTEAGAPMFKCSLTIQGIEFEAVGVSKKSARNDAVAQAFTQFAQTPPPVVNEKKKRKYPPRKKYREPEFTPIEPVELQDKIAKKCWDFVTEQIASIDETRKNRRNLVCIVKVEGEMEVDNCEVVAFGNGTLVIKQENMTSDGTTINDSTGESLALRALRRYLLDQVELCLANKPSIYIKDRSGGKCSLKPGVKLLMYTNSAPIGDARSYNITYDFDTRGATPATPETPGTPGTPATPAVVDVVAPDEAGDTDSPMEVTTPTPTRRLPFFLRHRKPRVYAEEDLGKIQTFVTDMDEITQISGDNSLCIVSPSDKLAMRQMAGVQGSVLFSLSQPVYLSEYLVNRTFDETAINRALYSRVKDVKVFNGTVEPPTFAKVLWRATRREERKISWSLIWAKGHAVEVLHAADGKQFLKEGAEEPAPTEMAEFLAQSEYCTKSLYTAYVNVCKRFKKSYPQKYSVAKYANTRYRQLKNAVISHLKDSGLGEWPERTHKPDY